MGQGESKESEQNPGQAPQHVRRNTLHGTERTRRPTPPIANPILQRPAEGKHTPATPQRPANTPQTFPRSRGLTNVRTRMTPSAASQRQASSAVRTSVRLQQQFAIRPARTAASSSSDPILSTPSRSQPIPISQPSTRPRPERPVQDRTRPIGRRSALLTKAAAETTESDPEPSGPPAKRVTRAAGKSTAAPATPVPTASSATVTATVDPSTTNEQPSEDETARTSDVAAESADSDDKMSVSVESDSSDDESDDAASHTSDSSEDPNELDQDLELGGSDDSDDDKSKVSEEKSGFADDAAGGLSVSGVSSQPSQREASTRTAAETQFQLRRSGRLSVPVRHLQVDPHRVSYISV